MRRVLVDTNVLLRFVNPADPQFRFVADSLDHLFVHGYRIVYAPQGLRELWNVMNRLLSANGQGATVQTAEASALLVESHFDLLHDTPEMHFEWRRLVVEHEVKGVQVHDARLAASAIIGGCRAILTFNDRDFKRFEVLALHPRDIGTLPT